MPRTHPNAYSMVQEKRWPAPEGENPVAGAEPYATGCSIEEGRIELGVFDYCR